MSDDARTSQHRDREPTPPGDNASTAGMAVRVTADRILCGIDRDGEKRSRGGILIPATAASKDRHGVWAEVVEVGPLVRSTAVGDKVLFLPDSAIDVDVHGGSYLIVRERDVHAIASAAPDAGGTGLYL
ncbi:MAG TPA: co-chaperone GroES [Euzebya sp.]|nr:co-chaperone GroES [Euzebya sp.]